MKSVIFKSLPVILLMMMSPSVYGHTAGEHSGGLMQQLMHIVQSSEHLFTILALGVVVSLLIHHLIKDRD